jgi:hypothetical protein
MIAATHLFQSFISRQPNVRTERRCSSYRRTDRECLLADDRRDCLQRLRQTALAETTRFLNARLIARNG